MTTYNKSTDFAAKDALLTGNPSKVVKGVEINTEFDNIAAADATNLKSGGALGTPSSGTLTNATGLPISTGVSGLGTGVATFLGTPSSANLAAALTDETGSGAAVFATSPTLVTPALGTPSALVGTNITGTASGLTSGAATNAFQLLGKTWAAPDPIGSTTPNTGAFTTLSTTGNAALGDAEATDTHAIKGATTVLANSANPAVKITQTGAGNAFVVEDSASTDSTPFVIDASGSVIVGHTTDVAGGYGDSALVYEMGGLPRHFYQGYSADTYAPVSEFAKSRNATIGSHTVVQTNDELGTVRFSGSDGTAFRDAASIRAFVDGTPGTNDMPGRLVFSTTADGASTPTERIRIDSNGNVLVTSAAGLGYGTGAGGTVTQATSKSTAVTLNKPTGQITMNNAALAAGASVYFSLVNSLIGSADTLVVHPVFFTGTSGNEYEAWVSYLVAGQAVIGVRNNTAGSRSDALLLNFTLEKGSTS